MKQREAEERTQLVALKHSTCKSDGGDILTSTGLGIIFAIESGKDGGHGADDIVNISI